MDKEEKNEADVLEENKKKKQQEEADKAKKDEPPPVVMDTRLLKAGDYELHVFLEETRGLVHPKDASSTVDPLIKVKAFDQSKNTKTKDKRGTGMTFWGEHLFFNKKIGAPVEFEVEKLKIEVMDHNTIGSDALIGEFEIDLVSIYFSDKHALQHQWVALSNLKKNFEEIKGFMKFSASCVGPGDEQISLQVETLKKGDEKQLFGGGGPMAEGRVLMPPQIQTQGYQMIISLVRGENFCIMDWENKSIDPYITFEFGTAKFKTRTRMSNRNPVWGVIIYLPYSEPTLNDILTIRVWDFERMSSDDIMGSTTFSKKNITQEKHKNFFWINIYGAQESGDKENSKIMNANPSLGTFWKGRVLLALEAKKCDNPKLSDRMKPEPIEAGKMNQLKRSDETDWVLMAEVYYGLSFPNKTGKYGIQFRWADRELKFSAVSGVNGIWEWYQRGEPLKCRFPYENESELPDLFIYITDGDERISYVRKDMKFLQTMLLGEAQLFYFKPDKSKQPKMKDFDAGIVKMRFTYGPPDIFENLSTGGWDKPLAKPNYDYGYLYANIYHAQDLIPADSDGNSDPFYVISYYGVEIGEDKDHIPDTLNPVWYKTEEIKIPYFPQSQSPPIIVKLFDYDTIGRDFLGSAVVNVQDGIKEGWICYEKNKLPEPRWIDLKYNNTTKSGRILISFNFARARPIPSLPKCYPEMETYYMKIKILGLRNLKSLGLLPVKRPFIKFDINSLKAKDQKQSLSEKQFIQTQPKETGSNPNLSTMIQFDIELPKNYLLCPSLNCVVFDCILKGLAQPVLGVFSINLSDFIKQGRERNSRKLRKASSAVLNKTLGIGGLNMFLQKQAPALPAGGNTNLLDLSGQQPAQPQVKFPGLGGLGGLVKPPGQPVQQPQLQLGSLGGIPAKTEEKKEELISAETVTVESQGGKKEGYVGLPEEKEKAGGSVSIDLEKKPMNISMEQIPPPVKERPSVFKESGGIRSEMIVIRATYAFDAKKKCAIEQDVPNPNEYMTIGYDDKEERMIEKDLDEPIKKAVEALKKSEGDEVAEVKQLKSQNSIKKDEAEIKQKEENEIEKSNQIDSKTKKRNTALISNPTPKRHYRYFVNTELEHTKFMDKNTFDEFKILRGKRIVEDSLFSKLIGADQGEILAGKFKGWIEIISKTDKSLLEQNKLNSLLPGLAQKRSFSSISVESKRKDINIDKDFMEKTPVIIRAYILQGITLAQMDEDSLSDPYIKVKLGDQVQDNEKEYQTDKTDCDFYKMFEFKSVLPGSSQLQIQIWDKDFLVKDDLIGETTIDLENRFFSRRWRKLNYVPIETRELRHPESTVFRGRVRLWLEIIPVHYVTEIKEIWSIAPKPKTEYELRVVVWDCEEVPSNDVEDCSDLYITGMVDEKQQKTDTHFRAQGGTGSFNWRMVWPISLPMDNPTVTFQIWDKDYFSPNDFISECTFDFRKEADEAWETDNSIKIYGETPVQITTKLSKSLNSAIDNAADAAAGKKVGPKEGDSVKKTVMRQDEKFIIKPKNTKKAGYSTLSDEGKITVSFELVPMTFAKTNKVGLGRNEPNHSPWLPPPVGRFEWSWNPITLFKRCVGPKARTKICICLCIVICTALLINLAPIIIGDLISAGLNKI